jgi:hypothetical protein
MFRAEGWSIVMARAFAITSSVSLQGACEAGVSLWGQYRSHEVSVWIVDVADSYRFFSSFRYAGVMILKQIVQGPNRGTVLLLPQR